jgi:putative ABC transport system permease protein
MGATQQAILRLVVRQAMALAGCGLAIGLAGALLLGRVMRSLLFGVTATDGLTYGAASLLLAFVALAASYVPARRAACVDPMASLRTD